MSLILKRQAGKVAHLNVREEKHGDEPIVAVDIKIEADVPNDFLETLAVGLRQTLYDVDQEQLKGVEAPLTVLRFPKLRPLQWEEDGAVSFTLHGAKKINDLVFDGTISKAIVLEALEGGTVELTFQVQVHPAPEQMGPLTAILGRSTKVSLKPEQIPEAGEDGGGALSAQQASSSPGAPPPGDWPFPAGSGNE